MDALTYLKEKARMTKQCNIECRDCPLNELACGIAYFNPKKAIEIVEEWAKENPVRTYKSVFFERFPNALKDNKGYPRAMAINIFGIEAFKDDSFDSEKWDEEYQEPRP